MEQEILRQLVLHKEIQEEIQCLIQEVEEVDTLLREDFQLQLQEELEELEQIYHHYLIHQYLIQEFMLEEVEVEELLREDQEDQEVEEQVKLDQEVVQQVLPIQVVVVAEVVVDHQDQQVVQV